MHAPLLGGLPILPLASLGRTLRTLVHVQPAQIYHRVRYTLRRRRWERRSAEIDDAYRVRAQRLGPMR